MDRELQIIGTVSSSLKRLEECPKQGDEGAPEAWVEINEAFVPGLDSLVEGQNVTLLTWMHQADREVLAVHPVVTRTARNAGCSTPVPLHVPIRWACTRCAFLRSSAICCACSRWK